MEHIGIDVHKEESQICILAEGGELIECPYRTSGFNQEEQDTSLYLNNLGMISALLIAGLLSGCGDSKQEWRTPTASSS